MLGFNSSIILRRLEKTFKIDHLIPDPTFGGCGLHSTGNGGRLMVHIDGNRYFHRNHLHQSLNLIYYTTKDWNPAWGGALELWDSKAEKCVKRIECKYNRLVVFDTNLKSYHGHPEPIQCPPSKRRNSLAAYYYVKERQVSSNYRGFQPLTWKRTSRLDKRLSIQYIRHKVDLAIRKVTPDAVFTFRRKIINLLKKDN
jgi:hypothetical protein